MVLCGAPAGSHVDGKVRLREAKGILHTGCPDFRTVLCYEGIPAFRELGSASGAANSCFCTGTGLSNS